MLDCAESRLCQAEYGAGLKVELKIKAQGEEAWLPFFIGGGLPDESRVLFGYFRGEGTAGQLEIRSALEPCGEVGRGRGRGCGLSTHPRLIRRLSIRVSKY